MGKVVKVSDDIRDLILQELEKQERRIAWLVKKTDIPYGTLYASLIQRTCQVSAENLEKINNVLKTDFSL